jgi:hypothetical protein
MTSIINTLGVQYVRQFCAGAYFRTEDKLCYLEDASSTSFQVKWIPFEESDDSWSRCELPKTAIPDFSAFAYPKMGYRNLPSNGLGHVVSMFSTRRSVHRGLRADNVNEAILPAYFNSIPSIANELPSISSEERRVRIIFNPTYVPFGKGLAELLSGETLGFAVSPDIAVVLSTSADNSKPWDVLYKGNAVGHVTPEGEVHISNKVVERSMINKLLKVR